MAAEDPFGQEDPRKKKLGAQDPLFYEGKTPVLGEDVSVQEPAGELTFPEAGPAAVPPPSGTNAAAPPFPAFPEFNLTPPEFNFPGGTPPPAPDIQLPQMSTPWWEQGLEVAQAGSSAYKNLKSLGSQPAEAAYPTVDPSEFTQYTPEGAFLGPEAFAPNASPLEPMGGPSVQSPEALFPEGSPGMNWGGAAIPGLQTIASAWSMANAIKNDNPEGMALAAPGLVGGAASTAAALAPGALGALAPGMAALGPAAALMTLPLIAGKLYERYAVGDKLRTPPGFTYVPGSGDSRGIGGLMVDPSSGRMLRYMGDGKYSWAEETQQGQLPTPEQFRQYEIEPTGKLAERPEYAAVNTQIRDADIARAGEMMPGTTVPRYPTEAHQRSYLETWREPYIARLRQQHPNADQGELWRLYTLTPEYQQELAMQQGWRDNPGSRPPGEVSEGGAGESNAPGEGSAGGAGGSAN